MSCVAYIARFSQELGAEIKRTLEQRTPVDSGKAKNSYTIQFDLGGFVISNYVDYIVALEDGHSAQAAYGMNRITLEDAPIIVRRVITKL